MKTEKSIVKVGELRVLGGVVRAKDVMVSGRWAVIVTALAVVVIVALVRGF